MRNVKIAVLIKSLEECRQKLVEKYCDNCQQWDCDECPYDMEGEDHD